MKNDAEYRETKPYLRAGLALLFFLRWATPNAERKSATAYIQECLAVADIFLTEFERRSDT